MKTLLFLVFGVAGVVAAEFRDGHWNGKPWEMQTLMASVEKGDPDALAEWAYCAANVGERLSFDRELVHDRSKTAAEAGSALGKLQYAICVERGIGTASDFQLSAKLLSEAAETGHPCALIALAVRKLEAHDRQRDYLGFEPDEEGGRQCLEEAIASGFYEAKHWSGRDLLEGYSGKKNYKKAARLAKESFLETGSLRSAAWMYKAEHLLSRNEIDEFLEDDVVEKAGERLRSAAALGTPYAKYVMGWEGVKGEKPHEAIPAFIESVNNKEPQSFWTATYIMLQGRFNKYVDSTVCSGNYDSIYKAAKEAYLRNHRANDNTRIVLYYAYGVIKKGTPEEKLEVATALRALIRDHREYPYSYTGLGYYYLKSSEGDHPEAAEHFRRCVALGTFRSDSPNGSLALAAYLGEWSLEKFRDYPKAYAAAMWAEELNRNAGCKQHARKIARHAWEAMDEGERLKAKQLVDEQYPYKRSYREEAFKYLKDVGDIEKFLPFYENSGEEEEDDPHFGFLAPEEPAAVVRVVDNAVFNFRPRPWGNLHFVMAEVAGESISDSQRKSVRQLLAGEILNDFYKEVFTRMVFRNVPRLKVILGRERNEATKDKVDFILKALDAKPEIDQGDNLLGAGFGWYLIYDKAGMQAMPLVNRLIKGGVAEKAGVRKADAIVMVNGVSTRGPNARNQFVRFLSIWPEGESMELVIGRNKQGSTDLGSALWVGERKEILVEF
ncbi:MAG: PDZ domain-containing protein [Verrucomicrobiota bacterium]